MSSIKNMLQRDALKKKLSELPPDHQLLFKRMYSHPNGKHLSPDLSASIESIVNHMDSSKLCWALIQAQQSLSQLRKIKK